MIGDPRGKNICFSGGAEGADTIFGTCADNVGHRVCHYGFSNHKSDCPFHFILTESQLVKADPFLIKAAKELDRGNFANYSTYTKNLLRRTYWTVKDTITVYAVSRLKYDGSQVIGGTGWGVYLATELKKDLWLYDMVSKKWIGSSDDTYLDWNNKPPYPHDLYAGIGSRELTEDGRQAIINLFKE